MKRPATLNARFVETVSRPGRYGDGRGGHGLSLLIKPMSNGRWSKSWSQRIRLDGKRTNLGLGASRQNCRCGRRAFIAALSTATDFIGRSDGACGRTLARRCSPQGRQAGAARGQLSSEQALARRRMVSATASPRALMRPMAKRRTCRGRCGCGCVLVEGPVEMWWGGLDGPVPAIEGEQALNAPCGDTTPNGLAVSLAGVDRRSGAIWRRPVSAGEVEVVVECAGDPDGAALAAPVLGFGALVGEVRCTLGDVLVEGEPDRRACSVGCPSGMASARWVSRASVVTVCPAMSGTVSSRGRMVPISLVRFSRRGRASCRFFLLQGRLGVVADDAEHMRLAALVIEGAAQRLAVDGQGSVA